MKIKAVFFDLDGTLLPLDQDQFVKAYLGLLAENMATHGYEPKTFVRSIYQGMQAMAQNDGTRTNEEAFWEVFTGIYGEGVREEPYLDEFYKKDFCRVQGVAGFSPLARRSVELCRALGARVFLATNPILPRTATEQRMAWAGFSPADFELYTTYENSSYSKPDLGYYREILDKAGLLGEECVMVGNDVDEDMIAESLGMRVFLLTDFLLNRSGKPIDRYPHGGFPELLCFLETELK